MREKRKRRYVTYSAKAPKKPSLTMRLVAKWSVLALIVIAASVVYVRQRNTIISIGYQINELRKGISAAGKEELKLRATLVTLQRPQRLLKEVKDRNLGLEDVSPGQVMSLVTPRPLSLRPIARRTVEDPPAASGPLAKVSAAAPHREHTVLRQRR